MVTREGHWGTKSKFDPRRFFSHVRTESKSSENNICFYYMSNEQHWTGIGSKKLNWYFIAPLYDMSLWLKLLINCYKIDNSRYNERENHFDWNSTDLEQNRIGPKLGEIFPPEFGRRGGRVLSRLCRERERERERGETEVGGATPPAASLPPSLIPFAW